MRSTRKTVCLVLALTLASSPALAQQPIQESAKRAATAAAGDASAPGQASSGHGKKFVSGTILLLAGGTAITLGTTVLKTADATSGNTPPGAFDDCVALQANPVYRGNQCDVLKGPNTGLVIGGAIAAAAGATLMMLGLSKSSSVQFGPRGLSLRHRVTF